MRCDRALPPRHRRRRSRAGTRAAASRLAPIFGETPPRVVEVQVREHDDIDIIGLDADRGQRLEQHVVGARPRHSARGSVGSKNAPMPVSKQDGLVAVRARQGSRQASGDPVLVVGGDPGLPHRLGARCRTSRTPSSRCEFRDRCQRCARGVLPHTWEPTSSHATVIRCGAYSSSRVSCTGAGGSAREHGAQRRRPDGGSPVDALVDARASTWVSTGAMATARHWHTATLLASGTVLGASCGVSAELYDTAGS